MLVMRKWHRAVDERARHTAAAFILPQCETMSRVRTVLGTVKAASPHPQWATPPQYVALRAHTTQGPAPGADDEQTRYRHDVTRSGQRSFRDTLDNPFGYPDSVLG
ncbi:hypothetical protein J6590_046908 [Homalodisca vitripennis]|nr:hypothetical protein J6590_046908 [Homalodisca vitripennis]